MGKYPEVNINYESFLQFPECGVDDLPQLASSPPIGLVSERSSSPLPAPEPNAGPSFAKVIPIYFSYLQYLIIYSLRC